MKLYPPSIESKLPAFTGSFLKIPFNMNKTVSSNEVFGMVVLIKTAQNGIIIGNQSIAGKMTQDEETGQYYAVFDLSKEIQQKLIIGSYYKVQIAYKDLIDEIGYFSSIGVIKYTSLPKLSIPQLENSFNSTYNYTGVYSQENEIENGSITVKRDQSEKIYSYCFEITDVSNNVIISSGTQLHNSENDTDLYISEDQWINKVDLPADQYYFITYKVTTMNGLEVSTQKYKILNQDSIDIELPIKLLATLNYDDGCIKLELEEQKTDEDSIIDHSIMVSRASSLDQFNTWEEICRIHYSKVDFLKEKKIFVWEDCSVQHGIEYKYAIQCYNTFGIYSNKTISDSIYVDFEDSFLSDGDRQLKIRFNPKVSSFKNTVLEQKVDTLGGQYPFVFRNGNVSYREFPISGLISMISDPNEKFIKGIYYQDSLKRPQTFSDENPFGLSTNLTANNIKKERDFKMEVLSWLNNGKPKIFRSPTEGNYIVRLMNISLSPNDTLGRMIHTFSSTAYEVGDYNITNLINLKLIKVPSRINKNVRVAQINCAVAAAAMQEGTLEQIYPNLMGKNDGSLIGFSSNIQAHQLKITEATPGTIITFEFRDGNYQKIQIGNTGTYNLQIDDPYVQNIYCDTWDDMKISYLYYFDKATDSFNYIKKINLKDEVRQFIGPDFNTNLVTIISDEVKRELGNFIYLRISKRSITPVYQRNNQYYLRLEKEDDWGETTPPTGTPIKIDCIPENGDTGPTNYYCFKPLSENYLLSSLYYDKDANKYIKWNGNNYEVWDNVDFNFKIEQNNESQNYNISSSGNYEIRNLENVTTLQVGNGLIVDMVYRIRTKTYSFASQTSASDLMKKYSAWQLILKKFEKGEKTQQEVEEAYQIYIAQLKLDIDKIKKGVQII